MYPSLVLYILSEPQPSVRHGLVDEVKMYRIVVDGGGPAGKILHFLGSSRFFNRYQPCRDVRDKRLDVQ